MLGGAQDVVPQGMTLEEDILELIVYQFGRRVVITLYLIADYLHLLVYLLLGVSGVEDDVGEEIHGSGYVLLQDGGIVYRALLVGVGTQAYDVHDDRRMPLYLLNNILGGPGMNAKLNLALREHNGLVYTVESTMVAYGDTGTWSIYFGCDEHDVKRCLRLVRKELDKFMEKPLSDAQLRAAKKQIKGQIGVACDNRENFALDFGKSFLHYGWEKNVDRLYEQVDAITAQQMQAVAQELFDEHRLTTLIFK